MPVSPSRRSSTTRSSRPSAARSTRASPSCFTLAALLSCSPARRSGYFVLALLIGIISGTYSSIFNASPLLVVWQEWEDRRAPAGRARGPRGARPPEHRAGAHGSVGAQPFRVALLRPGWPPGRWSPREGRSGILTLCSSRGSAGRFRCRWTWTRRSPESAGPRVGTRVLEVLARRRSRPANSPGSSRTLAARWRMPWLLPDAGVFVDRIRRLAPPAKRSMVFGDFDADGLTGLAVMSRALRHLGVTGCRRPRRLEEGHGLSPSALEAAAGVGRRLIVTVDCGTSSLAEVADAGRRRDRRAGHRPSPRAARRLAAGPAAIVNPQRHESSYPHRRLAGSGVAFKLAQLLLRDEPGGPAAALDLADLATIGTVADVAPILGENRSIARLGLERMRRAPRPGIAALLERAGVQAGTVTLETIAYVIAPRINAAGRVGEAADAAALLLADDPLEAAELADRLDAANVERRQLTRDAVDAAEAAVAAMAGDEAAAVMVRGPWPVGIVGLVGVAAGGPDRTAGGRGGRGGRRDPRFVPERAGFDLAEALRACEDLFTRYGGHAGAAGFELPAERWDAFVQRFETWRRRLFLRIVGGNCALTSRFPRQRSATRCCGSSRCLPQRAPATRTHWSACWVSR